MHRSLLNAALTLISAANLLTCHHSFAAEPDQTTAPNHWHLGTELDALPYAAKGYYGSLFAARDAWRLRTVAARATVPGFLVTNGFQDKRTDAYALLADRFLGPARLRQQGFWIGGGVELWRNRIRRQDLAGDARYHNVMLTAGGGYVWKLSRHFYLNPWAGAHFAVAGARTINVSGQLYQQPLFTPEASLKLGFTF